MHPHPLCACVLQLYEYELYYLFICMYELFVCLYVQFGCVPVILSDDLLWAYSLETGGFLNASNFAIQLPQKVSVERTQSTVR